MNTLALVLGGAAGAACAAVLFVVGVRLARTSTVNTLDANDLLLLNKRQRRKAEGDGPLTRMAHTLVPPLRRVLGPRAIASLQKRVDEAGRPAGLTVDGFLEQCTWWALLVAAPAVLCVILHTPFTLLLLLLCVTVPAVFPLSRLATAQRKRRERMERDLPDFLDVLAVTVTAGVTFRVALARVAERFTGPLAEEVTLTLHQIATGLSVRDAFSDLRSRTSAEPVGQFVSALLQSQELGSPLAESLNQIAVDIRRDSAQRQLQSAAKASPRVSLVSAIMLLPAVLILVIVGLVLGMNINIGTLLGAVR